jgi:hypothetical protein
VIADGLLSAIRVGLLDQFQEAKYSRAVMEFGRETSLLFESL